MADINKSRLETVHRQLNKAWQGAFDGAMPTDVGLFSEEIPMTTTFMRMDFLNDDPEFRRWYGPRKAHEYASSSHTVTYEPWELTIRMREMDIKDDNTGMYVKKASGGGKAAALLKPREIHEAIINGTTRQCFDGQNFFDTDHAIGEDGEEISYSNYVGGSGTSSSIGDDDSVDSPWYLIDPNGNTKPFVWLNRESPSFVSFTDYNNLHTFNLAEYLFGGKAYGAADYGLWQYCTRSEDLLCAANLMNRHSRMVNIPTSRKHEDGKRRRMGVKPTILLVGEANRERAELLMSQAQIHDYEADVMSPGATPTLKPNPVFRRYQVVVSPWLP